MYGFSSWVWFCCPHVVVEQRLICFNYEGHACIVSLWFILGNIAFVLFLLQGHKVRSKLYGVIVHGHWMACYAYAANLEGGSNVQIEVLH